MLSKGSWHWTYVHLMLLVQTKCCYEEGLHVHPRVYDRDVRRIGVRECNYEPEILFEPLDVIFDFILNHGR